MDKSKDTLTFDSEKEKKRWKQFLSALRGEHPSIGEAPRESVWQKNKTTLWYYPAKKKKYQVPILHVYSLVNQSFILDLDQSSSIINNLSEEGYDVYLLDWGIPGYEDKDLSLNDYILDYLHQGVKRVLRHSNSHELSIMGYCLGGTIAAIYAGMNNNPIKNLMLMVTPIDFSDPNHDQWIKALREDKITIDPFINNYRLIPKRFMAYGLRLLTSPLYFSHYAKLLNRSYDEQYVKKWERFNQWSTGHIPMSGEACRQMAIDLVKNNNLLKNEYAINGRVIDLKEIFSNLLVISTSGDQLVPKELSLPIMDLVSSHDKTFYSLEAGHASMALKGELPFSIKEWLHERSDFF